MHCRWLGRFSCTALTIASFVLLSTLFEIKANGMCFGGRYQVGMSSFRKQAADKAESRIAHSSEQNIFMSVAR